MAELAQGKDRRGRERFAARKGALAFNGRVFGPVVDASLAGICFQYITHRKWLEEDVRKCKASSSLDIVFGEHDFTLVGLPVKVVSDYQVEQSGAVASIRRRAVTFEELTPHQLFLLKRFLLLNRYAPRQTEGGQRQPDMDLSYFEQR